MSEMRPVLAATAARLFADHESAAPETLWQALETAGLTRASLAEDEGGADLGDVMAIVREAGAHAAPVPLAETLLAAWMLSTSGLDVPPGPLAIAPMLREDVPTLERAGATWRLVSRARNLPFAETCRALAVLARAGDAFAVALVPAAHVEFAPSVGALGDARADACFAVTLDDRAVSTRSGFDLDGYWRRGALTRVAAMAGALETVLAMTVRYAGERVQFGRPIGKFQAVQQEIAVLASHVAAAGAAADAAIAAADAGAADFAIAAAKARVGEAAGLAAALAHQVHGAMGFTQEHALHRFTTRLWSWREEFGDESYWWAWLGRRAAAVGGDGLWPTLTRPDAAS